MLPDHQSRHDPPLRWSAFLDELDQALSEPIALHCIGGFVVSLLYGLPRPTGDIDYIAAIPRTCLERLDNSQEEAPSSQTSTRFTSSTSRWPRCPKITKLD